MRSRLTEADAEVPVRARLGTVSSKYDFVKVKVRVKDHYYILSRFLISRVLAVTEVRVLRAPPSFSAFLTSAAPLSPRPCAYAGAAGSSNKGVAECEEAAGRRWSSRCEARRAGGAGIQELAGARVRGEVRKAIPDDDKISSKARASPPPPQRPLEGAQLSRRDQAGRAAELAVSCPHRHRLSAGVQLERGTVESGRRGKG
mmetsp:Transcript_41337/g.107030  ORF Transcript_41337/g.107030 Transcript_41337/m.107030 type:complete len:201 (-) Transcript_41337:3086-3688(-)